MQFWRSSLIFNDITINTYYLAETNTYLFCASNIFDVINKLNESLDEKSTIPLPISKSQIRVFQNDAWETVDVLLKDDIFNVTSSNTSKIVQCFEQWLENLCSNIPEGSILPKSSKEYEFLNLATNKFMDLYEK